MKNLILQKHYDNHKEQIKAWIDEIEIDVKELPSYKYTPACTAFNPEPEEEYWDEDEEWNAQCDKAIEYIEADGIAEYLNIEFENGFDEFLIEKIEMDLKLHVRYWI